MMGRVDKQVVRHRESELRYYEKMLRQAVTTSSVEHYTKQVEICRKLVAETRRDGKHPASERG